MSELKTMCNDVSHLPKGVGHAAIMTLDYGNISIRNRGELSRSITPELSTRISTEWKLFDKPIKGRRRSTNATASCGI